MNIKKIHTLSYNKHGGIDAVVEFDSDRLKGKHQHTIKAGSDIEKECLEGSYGTILDYIEPEDKRTYKEKRAYEYPPIGDQFDAIMKWLSTESGTIPDELKSIAMTCMAVKSKYPKPEEQK